MRRKALITGITGQGGYYLAELQLSEGHEVHGIIRRASTFSTSRIDRIFVDPHEPGAKLFLYYGIFWILSRFQISFITYNQMKFITWERKLM